MHTACLLVNCINKMRLGLQSQKPQSDPQLLARARVLKNLSTKVLYNSLDRSVLAPTDLTQRLEKQYGSPTGALFHGNNHRVSIPDRGIPSAVRTSSIGITRTCRETFKDMPTQMTQNMSRHIQTVNIYPETSSTNTFGSQVLPPWKQIVLMGR